MRLQQVIPFALFAIGCAQATPGEVPEYDGADVADFAEDTDLAPRGFDLEAPADLAPATLICVGETYDVNANASDGCEVTDTPLNNHAQSSAVYVGSFSCDDGPSAQNIPGLVPADARAHSPVVTGFDSASGSAPDWFRIHGSGGTFCEDDLNLHLAVTGSAVPTCYLLTANTSNGTYTCQSDATGNCGISKGSGSYSDGSDIYVHVSKTCAGNDKASYTITGHL